MGAVDSFGGILEGTHFGGARESGGFSGGPGQNGGPREWAEKSQRRKLDSWVVGKGDKALADRSSERRKDMAVGNSPDRFRYTRKSAPSLFPRTLLATAMVNPRKAMAHTPKAAARNLPSPISIKSS